MTTEEKLPASGQRLLPAIIASVLAMISLPLQAQEWPSRAVKFVIPFGPGSSSDTAARLVSDRLQAIWGKPIVIEPRPGGDAVIAINAFVGANDDHTIFFGPSSVFVTHPHRYAKLNYNRETDMIPVAQMSTTTLGFAIPASLPARNLKEFIAYTKANPGKVSVATAPGTSEMMLDAFTRDEKLDMAKIPYRDVVQSANDLANGRIQAVFAALTIFQAGLQGNTIRVISITGTKPTEAAPGVATAIEQGYPRLGQEGLMGIFAPSVMSEPARRRLEQDFLKVVGEPDVARRLAAIGQVHFTGTAREFDANIRKQASEIAEIANMLGIKPQ